MTNLNVEQLQKWYKKQLRKQSKDFIKQAERSYKIVERALKEIEEIVEQFEEDEADESEDGTTVRFAHKVREIVQNFYVEKEITYENTEAMQAEIERFVKDLWSAGRRWIKRMDKRFKALVKSMDVALKDLTKEMSNIGKLLFSDAFWQMLIEGAATFLVFGVVLLVKSRTLRRAKSGPEC